MNCKFGQKFKLRLLLSLEDFSKSCFKSQNSELFETESIQEKCENSLKFNLKNTSHHLS